MHGLDKHNTRPLFRLSRLLPMSAIWLTVNAGGSYRGFPRLAALQIVQYNSITLVTFPKAGFGPGLHPLVGGKRVKEPQFSKLAVLSFTS
jgi:hypothetical protein